VVCCKQSESIREGVRHYNTEKEKNMGLIKAAMGACGTVNKGKFCANCGTPRT
jgi:hypothetical protein